MKKQSFLKTLPIALIINFSLYAKTNELEEFKLLYKNGQYAKAISALENIDIKNNIQGEKYYLTGLCYAKLQEYDKAALNYESAIKENNPHPDLYYEYGQALYASNELKAARKAFNESVNKKFNVPASLYYVAHISQILEEYPEARNKYSELIKDNEADTKIKQIAKFQLAETLLMMMREQTQDKEKLGLGVEKYIIPQMRQAHKADKSAAIANEIDQRIQELEKEFNLDPNLLKNGRRISPKRYNAYVSQKIKFDDNISLTNEENNVSQSKKESFIFESEAYAKYDFVLRKQFIVSPELRLNFVQNSDQDSPEVFQNDTSSININIKNKYEHTLFSAPASLLFDIEFSKNYKDWKQEHKRIAYADSLSFGIGEAFSYFKVGDTSFRIKRKSYNGENESISNKTISASADQTVAFANQSMLIALFEADFIDNFNNKSTNTNTYLTRIDYVIPDIMPKYTLDVALGTTITDTKDQKATRGTEVSLNPSLDLSKEINDKMKLSVNYDFTKSNSKQADYKYSKSVFSTEFRYSF